MKTMNKLAAVAFALCAAVLPASAGKGGSNAAIVAAVSSGSTDAIIAEVERAEGLMCQECVQTVTALTEDNRYAVREVAAWWFAKRPGLARIMAEQMIVDLGTDSTHVRNAADFLGAIKEYKSLPVLRTTMVRGGLSSEAKIALVRAAGSMAHVGGNPILIAGMADGDAAVRLAAVSNWREVLDQKNAQPVEALLGDANPRVRAEAASVLGVFADGNVRATLEQLVVSDADPYVRRNAAWALGKIGSADSRQALLTASNDKSGIVKGFAKASLSLLK